MCLVQHKIDHHQYFIFLDQILVAMYRWIRLLDLFHILFQRLTTQPTARSIDGINMDGSLNRDCPAMNLVVYLSSDLHDATTAACWQVVWWRQQTSSIKFFTCINVL